MSEIKNSSLGLPRLNEHAPEFEAKTTQGVVKLSDFRGRWVLLFSHPADFTPVCTSEVISFSENYGRFKALNCELLGLSLDSRFAHFAWIDNIKKKFNVEVPFPIIEDVSMQVARAYGMIQPGASDVSTVRAAFMIDGKGIMRAMFYYPMSNGRSVQEFLRLLVALQTTDAYGVATPEGWQLGEKVIVPPPSTSEEVELRLQQGYECVDWYFCKKDLGKDILKKIA